MKLKARELASGTSWRAIYVDPDSKRSIYETLEPHDARTVETRKAWAVDKAKDLAQRRRELDQGATRATGEKLTEAIARYYTDHPRLRARTIKTYRNATDKFIAWAASARVVTVDDLNRAKLIAFRNYLIAQPKRRSVRSGARGEAAPTSELRSAVVVNQELRSVGTVLRYLLEVDAFARLKDSHVRRALKAIKTARNPPTFLSLAECKQLMRAALLHDADTFAETRAEHAGEGRRSIGTTNRYDPIAPFVATVLLTGMRVGEALALRWSYAHLDLVDPKGKPIGELRLPSEATKTEHGRNVRLDISPTVRELLVELQEQADDDDEYVFGGKAALARDVVEAARKRLASYGAPKHSWQLLRSTCCTVSSNAVSMWIRFGHSAPFASAKRAGHAPTLAERRYADVLAVASTARTLETAMTIDTEIAEVLARVRARRKPAAPEKQAANEPVAPARRRLRAVGAQ